MNHLTGGQNPYITATDGTWTGYQGNSTYTNLMPEPFRPKFPGHWCESYDQFRQYVQNSPNVPGWVKEAFKSFDNEDDIWQVEMWSGIVAHWQGRRVQEIKEAQQRLIAK
jgi:hypothetical protein